jgi:hypothetical protein
MEKRLILRTVDKDRKSYGGFVWPELGYVEATDWQPTESCGNGLHGFLWGEGDGSLADWSESAKWIVAEIIGEHIDLGGKVKFRAATVLFCGERIAATDFLAKSGAAEKAIIGGTATAGYGGTATAGYGGTATAGDGGTATAGYGGTATAGDRGTATAGDGGTATAGDGGTATAGYGGTATAGDGGTATAGYGGTATAGYGGTVVIKFWDVKRYRLAIGYVGEDIKANTKYRADAKGRLIEA